jgi:hypothetical protein
MTKEFFKTLDEYNNRFISAESPLMVMENSSFDEMLEFMNMALEQNEPLEFDYRIERDEFVMDALIIKIGDKIIK